MADRNSTAASTRPDHATVEGIINTARHFAETLNDQREQTLALSLAGEAWAGQNGADGEEIDTTSRLIFGTIRDLQEGTSNYHALINSLNDLRDLVAQFGKKGGA